MQLKWRNTEGLSDLLQNRAVKLLVEKISSFHYWLYLWLIIFVCSINIMYRRWIYWCTADRWILEIEYRKNGLSSQAFPLDVGCSGLLRSAAAHRPGGWGARSGSANDDGGIRITSRVVCWSVVATSTRWTLIRAARGRIHAPHCQICALVFL
jgi:hypothetical protein